MANNFKVYDPVAQLIASGPSLPLSGGTLTGNLTLTAPAKVIQCQNPAGPCDLVNLQYLNSALGTPGSIPGSSITNNSITNSQLAAGAAAGNINSGPDEAITGTKVQKAGNTQFGVIQFDAAGELQESALNSGIALIRFQN